MFTSDSKFDKTVFHDLEKQNNKSNRHSHSDDANCQNVLLYDNGKLMNKDKSKRKDGRITKPLQDFDNRPSTNVVKKY